jgi:hypothetical protein
VIYRKTMGFFADQLGNAPQPVAREPAPRAMPAAAPQAGQPMPPAPRQQRPPATAQPLR